MFSVLGGRALIVRDDRKPYHNCLLPKTLFDRRLADASALAGCYACAGFVNPTAEIAAADWSVFISGFSGILSLLMTSSSSWDAPEGDMA